MWWTTAAPAASRGDPWGPRPARGPTQAAAASATWRYGAHRLTGEKLRTLGRRAHGDAVQETARAPPDGRRARRARSRHDGDPLRGIAGHLDGRPGAAHRRAGGRAARIRGRHGRGPPRPRGAVHHP